MDPTIEQTGGCLVMVDAVAVYHAEFVRLLREHYGKVLATGIPRITRYRPGASRFTLMDPSGKLVISIQRDESAELEHGRSTSLTGLAQSLDNARILREFKTDDRQAFRAWKSAFRKYGPTAPATDHALALIQLGDIARELGEPIEPWVLELQQIQLTDQERQHVFREMGHIVGLTDWLT
ncbi:hypothetical protein [Lysinibacter cavernae]|uniref:hypothetical protein n=1 Tax=Lysinibacter cavernae TaxID=1640652 RepID=UPI003610E9AE